MSLKNWPDETYPGCDVSLPTCKYLPIDGKPEPTTIPKIKCNVKLTTCGKNKCVETSRLPKCRECTTEVIIYKCAHLEVNKSHHCKGCRPSKSKYLSSRPELRLVPHNENSRGGKVCDNYSDHEERRKKRKELIPQQEPTQPPYNGHQYPYPQEREPETQYARTPVMTPTHGSAPLPYGGYGYAGGYPLGQPNPQYIPVPGSAIPPAWKQPLQPLQPLIIEENPQMYANWENGRQREEPRFSSEADRISAEEAVRYESTLHRGKAPLRVHRRKNW